MLLQIDATFLFVLLSFVIFLCLMNLICYKPIMKVMAEREKLYEKNKKTVFETNSKKENVEKEINDEISKTKLESSKMLKNATEVNKEEKLGTINAKKEMAKTEIIEFENSLENNSSLVKEQLKNEVETYVKSVVSKVLNQNADNITIQREKIDEILK